MYLGDYLGATAYLGDIVDPPEPVVTTAAGWYSLVALLAAARDEATRPHPEDDECPHDGTRYLVGGDAGQAAYCPFCGHRPGGRTS
jgi:hypothetical protein